jgi:hypothetical protein
LGSSCPPERTVLEMTEGLATFSPGHRALFRLCSRFYFP